VSFTIYIPRKRPQLASDNEMNGTQRRPRRGGGEEYLDNTCW